KFCGPCHTTAMELFAKWQECWAASKEVRPTPAVLSHRIYPKAKALSRFAPENAGPVDRFDRVQHIVALAKIGHCLLAGRQKIVIDDPISPRRYPRIKRVQHLHRRLVHVPVEPN